MVAALALLARSLRRLLQRARRARDLLEESVRDTGRVYRVVAASFGGRWLTAAALGLVRARTHLLWATLGVCALELLILGEVMCSPQSHARVQAWLAARDEGASTAAAIASLIEDRSTADVAALARRTFRAVRACDVTAEAIASSTPNKALYEQLSSACELGACDGFVSHSWTDQAASKWRALQAWRAAFVAKHGREPLIWLDRLCVDQESIGDNLACLPVYLAGCNSLVMLVGPTYLSRLWCAVELEV